MVLLKEAQYETIYELSLPLVGEQKRARRPILCGVASRRARFFKICPHSWVALVVPANMHGMWP